MGDPAPYLAAAARVLAADRARCDQMTPRAVAEAAYYAGGPSVEEIESRIVAARAGALPLAA